MFRHCGIFCFSIGVWKCCDSVVFFVFLLEFGNVPTVWYFLFFYWSLEMFRQCGIFCFSIGSLEMFRQCGIFCFSIGSLEMFRHCGIFCFSIGVWKCSDSVAFFVFLLEFGNVPTVWYFFAFHYILRYPDNFQATKCIKAILKRNVSVIMPFLSSSKWELFSE